MKSVYIDVLIVVNIFIDFFLILCTKQCLHLKSSYIRMILGAIAGGALSLTALLPTLLPILNLLINISGIIIIILITFEKCTVKCFIKRVTVYFAFSFIFCGIMIFVYTIFKPKKMEIYNDVIYLDISPILLIILTLICYYILNIIKRLTKGVNGFETCNIEIIVNQKQFNFIAKIDTGCNLKEPFSGFDVIIAENDLFGGYCPKEYNMRLIPFTSLGGKGVINGFRPDEVIINNKSLGNEFYIGLCKNIMKGDIKALISTETANK